MAVRDMQTMGSRSSAAAVAHTPIRCAIYTRKSTDENLDSDFNSLDAQRESCEHFIRSHAHENWGIVSERYDDGAYSGATMERPALRLLLADIEDGKVDCVVLYKIDRLSRSLLDFTRMMEFFKAHEVAMVSVTQAFQTNTSSGTLMTHLLMTFAAYERDVCAERIRDKVAASKRRGKYMGGAPPLGYDVDREEKRLVVNAEEAALVRFIFRRYLRLRSPVALIKELNAKGLKTKSWVTKKGVRREGRSWRKSHIYRLLQNPIYIGKVKHKDQVYPGEHEALIKRSLWNEVQRVLVAERKRGGGRYAKIPSLLKGVLVCGHCKTPMGVTYTQRHGKRYRYYLCRKANKSSYDSCPIRAVSAGDLEHLVLTQVSRMLNTPELAAERNFQDDRLLSKHDLAVELKRLVGLWEDLFPGERHRIVRILVDEVVVSEDGVDIALSPAGVEKLLLEMKGEEQDAKRR